MIDKVQIFQTLNNKQKALLANAMLSYTFAAGEPIFRENDEASTFYLIQKGKVKVEIPKK